MELEKIADEALAKLPEGSGLLILVVYPDQRVVGASNFHDVYDTIELCQHHIRQVKADKRKVMGN